ncbi:MAG TPA: hypothetical protein VHM88_25330 [Candidatus Acidoferrales bacterium]|jgi:hypothetical protein|nr:hypothetical protein [Candidatus Acidoferrales bacterium]
MKRIIPGIALLGVVFLTITGALASQTAQPERWLHVRVESQATKGEMVRVNVPLSLAEKVLPTIHNDRLQDGKVAFNQADLNGVDLRGLLEAVRGTRDGEFVTVQGHDGEVRVAKQGGYLLVHARENKETSKKHVEVRAPLTVVDALLSAGNNQLDLVAALRALAAHGDTELVSVKDEKSNVRIWVDSKSASD